jgi:hypothetical protein
MVTALIISIVTYLLSSIQDVLPPLKNLSQSYVTTVSWSVYLGVMHPSGAQEGISITVRNLRLC